MNRRQTYPQILLPGPIQRSAPVEVRGSSSRPDGTDFELVMTFDSDGRGLEQVTEQLQLFYSRWHDVLGEEITIDFGKGKIRRVLDEQFGEFFLTK